MAGEEVILRQGCLGVPEQRHHRNHNAPANQPLHDNINISGTTLDYKSYFSLEKFASYDIMMYFNSPYDLFILYM